MGYRGTSRLFIIFKTEIKGGRMEQGGFLDKYFKLTERGSNVHNEVIGGLTTFLAMAYIIFVNPSILSLTGMDKGALITVTCLATALGTFVSGVWANAPFGLAPGMGLNAFFTFTLVMERGVSWQTALGIVFLSGCFFFILSIGGIRERIADCIPISIKISVGAGIGLFITLIGLKNMGLVVKNDATLVGLGSLGPEVLIGLIGFFIAILLEIKRVKGGILIGILSSTVLALIMKKIEMPGALIALPPSMAPIFMQLDIKGAFQLSLLGAIFSFMFVDLFDSLGTLISCSKEIGLVDENGKIKGFGRMLYTDVASTIFGAMMGTSTVTTFVESSAGIAAGARTGLASIVTSVLFMLSLFFAPIVGMVPAYATAPALIIVGVYMFKNVQHLDFKNLKTLVPAFVIIIMMPLTYSISIGLSLGFLAYIIIHVLAGDLKSLNIPLIGVGILSLVNLIV